jgi:hypothetical protein
MSAKDIRQGRREQRAAWSTDYLKGQLRGMAGNAFDRAAHEVAVLHEAADRLERMERRLALLDDYDTHKHSGRLEE